MKALVICAVLAGCAQPSAKRGAAADEWTRSAIRAAPDDPRLPKGLRRYSEVRERLPKRRCLEWLSYEERRVATVKR